MDTLKWLLDHDTSGTAVKVTDEVGGTPAHDAADNGELECLTLLVQRGANIFAEDLNKATPYLLGLESGNDAVKTYLRNLAMSLGTFIHKHTILLQSGSYTMNIQGSNNCVHNRDFIISELNLIQTLCKLLNWDHRACS